MQTGGFENCDGSQKRGRGGARQEEVDVAT